MGANDGAELSESRRRQAEYAQRRKRLEKEMMAAENALECAARCVCDVPFGLHIPGLSTAGRPAGR